MLMPSADRNHKVGTKAASQMKVSQNCAFRYVRQRTERYRLAVAVSRLLIRASS